MSIEIISHAPIDQKINDLFRAIKKYDPYFSLHTVVNYLKAKEDIKDMSLYPFVKALDGSMWSVQLNTPDIEPSGVPSYENSHIMIELRRDIDISTLIPDIVDISISSSDDVAIYSVICTSTERASEIVEEISYIELILYPMRILSDPGGFLLQSHASISDNARSSKYKLYSKWREIYLYSNKSFPVTDELVSELQSILLHEESILEDKKNASESDIYDLYKLLEGRSWSVEGSGDDNGFLILDDRSINIKNVLDAIPGYINIEEVVTNDYGHVNIKIQSDAIKEFMVELQRMEFLFHPVRTHFPWDGCIFHE